MDDSDEDLHPVPPQKRWSLKFLREQFQNVEEIYTFYVRRLSLGYFSVFLLMQIVLSLGYVIILSIVNTVTQADITVIIPDVVVYSAIVALSLIGLLSLKEDVVLTAKNENLLHICSLVSFAVIYVGETGLSIYHFVEGDRFYHTPNTTHLIISCYIFFFSNPTSTAVGTALLATLTNLILFVLINHDDFTIGSHLRRLFIEMIYFACVNMLGMYFRYLSEIMHRRSFLDRKDATNLKIQFDQEKQQRETLLAAIIPSNITERVLHDEHIMKYLQNSLEPTNIDAFSYKDFLTEHENVTILYADIVNYTEMTTKITPAPRLVEVLNDLFGSFDNDSEELGVTRIKFLGDCYYCVSGLPPKPNEEHADACVQLGLRMITTVQKVSEHKKVDLNVRVGMHTGNILTGIIGLTRWQLEIWSKDVRIANKMESSGFPGMVHLTQATKDQLRSGTQYHIAETNAFKEDDFLQKHLRQDKTYIISPVPLKDTFIDVDLMEKTTKKRDTYFTRRTGGNTRNSVPAQNAQKVLQKIKSLDLSELAKVERRSTRHSERQMSSGLPTRRSQSGSNVHMEAFREREKTTNEELRTVIEEMPLSKYAQWFQVSDISALFLVFKNVQLEMSYALFPDPLFKYYAIGALMVLLSFIAIRFAALPHWDSSMLLSLMAALICVVLVPVLQLPEVKSWEKWERLRRSSARGESDDVEGMEAGVVAPKISKWLRHVPKCCHQLSAHFVNNALLRTAVFLLVCCTIILCFAMELTHCDYEAAASYPGDLLLNGEDGLACLPPWNITEIVCLTLMLVFLFLKIHVWLKFAVGACVGISYAFWLWQHALDYFEHVEARRGVTRPTVAHLVSVAYVAVGLHLVDRQADYMGRLGHKWTVQLSVATRSAAALRETNQRLLANVMPLGVAERYFRWSRDDAHQKHYCEHYKIAAVMFATIVNFEEASDDPTLNLTLLNQIVSDFDRVLQRDRYRHRIEKIKLAHLTYVACSGLTPGRPPQDQESYEDAQLGIRSVRRDVRDRHLIRLLEFAVDIRKVLDKHNRETNHDAQLRIGICDGEMTAGVVGTKKPNYDVWGDPVNMASRMDTTGQPGCIQVWESTNMVLRRNGYVCDLNGQFTYVKGKSEIPTFNVRLVNGELVRTTFSDIADDDEQF